MTEQRVLTCELRRNRDKRLLHTAPKLLDAIKAPRCSPSHHNNSSSSNETDQAASRSNRTRTLLDQWTPASAPRLEPAAAVDPAPALTAPAPPAKKAAAHAARPAAASAPLAACAKGRPATRPAVSEEPTRPQHPPCDVAFAFMI
ncbi:hypothetical protein Q5P01_012140 [Channa striata]|uniref:Uncharacterized protein n=1 Tax=Channa striata TaxID=64152 RepID=A0AA88MP54_CHASR|nr:hypothetical protein Q5P01_012140 [Channa striata]